MKKSSELFKSLTNNSLEAAKEVWDILLTLIYVEQIPFKNSIMKLSLIEDDSDANNNFNIRVYYKNILVKDKNIYHDIKSYFLINNNTDIEISVKLKILPESSKDQKVSVDCMYWYSPTDLKDDLSFDEGLIKSEIVIDSEIQEIQNCKNAVMLSLIREFTYAELRIERLDMFYHEKDIILSGKINQLKFLSSKNTKDSIEDLIKKADINLNNTELKKIKKFYKSVIF